MKHLHRTHKKRWRVFAENEGLKYQGGEIQKTVKKDTSYVVYSLEILDPIIHTFDPYVLPVEQRQNVPEHLCVDGDWSY